MNFDLSPAPCSRRRPSSDSLLPLERPRRSCRVAVWRINRTSIWLRLKCGAIKPGTQAEPTCGDLIAGSSLVFRTGRSRLALKPQRIQFNMEMTLQTLRHRAGGLPFRPKAAKSSPSVSKLRKKRGSPWLDFPKVPRAAKILALLQEALLHRPVRDLDICDTCCK